MPASLLVFVAVAVIASTRAMESLGAVVLRVAALRPLRRHDAPARRVAREDGP